MKSYIVLLFTAFTIISNAQTNYNWVGGDGNWSNPNKWSPVGVPGSPDTAEITVDGNYIVTLDLDNLTVAGLRIGYPGFASTLTQELYIQGKTFTVNDSVKINVRGKLKLWENSILDGTAFVINEGTLLIKQSSLNNDLLNKPDGYCEAYSQSSLNGNIVNDGFLGTYGTYGYGSAFLTIANGFSNQGTVRLWGDNTGGSIVGDATITVTNGSLVNNNKLISGGTETYGGNNYLKAELINNDSVIIYSRPFDLNKSGAHHVNNGNIQLINSSINDREFNIIQSGSAPFFNNNGSIRIENSCKMVIKSGILNINSDDVINGGILVAKDTCLVNLNVNYTSQDSSSIELRNMASVNGTGILTNQGSLVMFKGSINSNVINTVSGYIQAFGQSSLNGNIKNEGFLGAYGTYGPGDAFLTIANGFTNEGTVRLWGDNTGSIVGNATLTVTNGNITNNNKVISGGTEAYGGYNYLKAELINNDSVIIYSRSFDLDKADANHVNNGFIHFKKSATDNREFIIIQSGADPSFENYGTFKIDSTNILKLNQGNFINQPGGVVTGLGYINSQNGTLSNQGDFLPGDSIGFFYVTGNYPEESTSVLEIDIGGYAAGTEHDRLNVSANAMLSGILKINRVNNFTPVLGDSLLVLTFGSRTGSFISIVDSSLAVGTVWDTVYTINGLYIKLIEVITIIEDEAGSKIPAGFVLNPNYPNPFSRTTKINWISSVSSWQTLKVFDLFGNDVATLVDEYKPSGAYEVEWDAKKHPGGVYIAYLQAGKFAESKMIILQK
ncbi:MAG: hypothetical protein FJY07_02290 [Bacteroidetes bacterium]|nr:hypothetical protein [Bacteroidota bacterium]